jgi:hypothetical protein
MKMNETSKVMKVSSQNYRQFFSQFSCKLSGNHKQKLEKMCGKFFFMFALIFTSIKNCESAICSEKTKQFAKNENHGLKIRIAERIYLTSFAFLKYDSTKMELKRCFEDKPTTSPIEMVKNLPTRGNIWHPYNVQPVCARTYKFVLIDFTQPIGNGSCSKDTANIEVYVATSNHSTSNKTSISLIQGCRLFGDGGKIKAKKSAILVLEGNSHNYDLDEAKVILEQQIEITISITIFSIKKDFVLAMMFSTSSADARNNKKNIGWSENFSWFL